MSLSLVSFIVRCSEGKPRGRQGRYRFVPSWTPWIIQHPRTNFPLSLLPSPSSFAKYDSEENVLSLLSSEKHERKMSSFEELHLFFVRNILTMVVTPIQKTESTQILAVVWKLNRNIFFFNRRGPQHPVIIAKAP